MPATDPSPPAAADRRLEYACAGLLFLLTLALNAKVLDFSFLYLRDDDTNVALNPYMGRPTAERLAWMFTDTSYVRRYLPLGWLNFSATYQWSALRPAGYHAVGLALAALDAVLVFAVIRAAQRRWAAAGPWPVGAAALAAGWWAAHPLRVETTAWVSGNLYGQALACVLLALWAYLESGAAAGARRALLLGYAAAAYAASLLTYPIALGVPFLLIGLDAAQPRPAAGPSFRRLLLEKLLFLGPLAAVLAVTVAARLASGATFKPVPGLGDLPLAARAAQAAYIAAYYLWRPWWPFGLSPLYDTLARVRPADLRFVAAVAFVLAASAVAAAGARRRPLAAALWFGYLAVVAPFFGLTEQPHMPHDRYAALPTVLAAALLAAGLGRLRRPGARALAGGLLLALTLGLAALSWRQEEIWRTDQAQHRYVAARLTDRGMLASFTSRQLFLEFMRGNEAGASQAIAAALAREPRSPSYNLVASLIADKRRVEGYYGAATLLAIVHEQNGLALARQGELREANDHLEEALALSDHFYQAAFDRAHVLLRLGRGPEALGSFYLAERWAHPALSTEQRRTFFFQLQQTARAAGDGRLAEAAGRAAGP